MVVFDDNPPSQVYNFGEVSMIAPEESMLDSFQIVQNPKKMKLQDENEALEGITDDFQVYHDAPLVDDSIVLPTDTNHTSLIEFDNIEEQSPNDPKGLSNNTAKTLLLLQENCNDQETVSFNNLSYQVLPCLL
jgi:hypothetical protein